jgi:hypothetical protein
MFRCVSVWKICVGALVLASLAGCGSGSGSNAAPSPYEGTRSGPFTRSITVLGVATSSSGTESLTIARDGSFNGTVTNTTLGNTATITGTIASSGDVSASVVYPLATYVLSGTLGKNASGQLTGTLQVSLNNSNVGTETPTLTLQ